MKNSLLLLIPSLLFTAAVTEANARPAEPDIPSQEGFEWVIRPHYRELGSFRDSDLAPAEFWDEEGGLRHYYIDRNGNPVLEFDFEFLGPFFEERAVVGYMGGPYGVIDRGGNIIVQPVYEDLDYYQEGLCPFEHEDRGGYLDRDGNEYISSEGIRPGHFSDGYAVFYDRDAERFGVLDRDGLIAIQPIFERLGRYCDGLFPAEAEDGMCGYIDLDGNWAIEPLYDYVLVFSQGRGAVGKDGKWGFVNTRGNIVVPLEYDYISRPFSDGMAVVEVDDLQGCVDLEGNLVIECKFSSISPFSDGYAFASAPGDRKEGIIDKSGNWVVEPCFDVPYPFIDGLACVRVGQKWGIIRIKD
ncbi:MAG: WG repeat-containing protein [Rikenellaceae bacterium]|nr:WG repeat-containing protein [Rikenellaceae bacterium]